LRNAEGLTANQSLVRSYSWLLAGLLGVGALFVLGEQPFAVGLVPLPLWLALMIPLLISAADEFHQMFLPGRQPGLEDWLAGLCGVALAAWWRHR